jgi:5-methylcytosine-specific restriction endonuclease McrA
VVLVTRWGDDRHFTPLKRRAGLKRRTPLKAVSDKRKARRGDWEQVKGLVFDRDGHACQGPVRGLPGPCGGPLDAHHVRPQGRYPELRYELSNLWTLCRFHHSYSHDHPKEAKALGLVA